MTALSEIDGLEMNGDWGLMFGHVGVGEPSQSTDRDPIYPLEGMLLWNGDPILWNGYHLILR